MSFSIEERTSCVLWYTETESIVTTQRRFVQKFGKKIIPPSNKSIKKWYRKLKSTGTVEKPRAHQPSVLDPQPIIDHFKGNPKTSLRRAANILNISHVSVHNILKKHKFHPYKVKIVQELHANDYAARMAFADEMLDKILHSQDFLQHLQMKCWTRFCIHRISFNILCFLTKHISISTVELTLTIVVTGALRTLTGQQRSPFIHLEQLYGRPYGMGELSAQFSSIQMLMVIIT